LNLLLNATAQAIPSNAIATVKVGLEYTQDALRTKLLANVRDFTLEHQLTYRIAPWVVGGYNLVFAP